MAASMRTVRLLNKNDRKLFSSLTIRHNVPVHNVKTHRCYHIRTNSTKIDGGNHRLLGGHNSLYVCAVPLHRFKSTEATTSAPDLTLSPDLNVAADSINYIPEPPSLPTDLLETLDLNALGEPTLHSLGLGGFSFPGLVQQGLDLLHVSLGLPWWGAIIAGTLVIRICLFPLVIKGQRHNINYTNHSPVIQRLQEKFSTAKMRGDYLEATRVGSEMQDYLKRNDCNPLKAFIVPLCQIPIFVSVFWGLRRMAYLPVESMKTGGLAWFTDLTIADPFYGLPIITMLSLYAQIELGADGMGSKAMSQNMKYAMRVMPLVIFYFVSNFPAAMCVYWATSNTISLVQAGILRTPKIRKYFNMPAPVKHRPPGGKKKGVIEGYKDSMDNFRLMRLVNARQANDNKAINEAARGPIPKTYAYNPKERKNKEALRARSN